MARAKAKYEVLEAIKRLESKGNIEFTTTQIANEISLTRGVVSHYLSQLLQEGLVEKIGARPVYWRQKNKEDPFVRLIGSNHSLNGVIKECKAATDYPPNGFPLIITGESGTGKSFLASLIYEYAISQNYIKNNAPFVVLNCADYANNPELLSSILFGYKKGAFTGADQDTLGLADKADKGYLFLDEIHRLPRENQEKLFTLLDYGKFMALGGDTENKVTIRFIFATTESLDDSLLTTFRRRVPMTVNLPRYKDRPEHERALIVNDALISEAKRLDRQFKVATNLYQDLIDLDLKGNVGGLKNKIKLICAKAFSEQKSTTLYLGKDSTYIDFDKFQENISQNYLIQTKEIVSLLEVVIKKIKTGNEFGNTSFLMTTFLRKNNGNSGLSDFYRNELKAIVNDVQFKRYGINEYLTDDFRNKYVQLRQQNLADIYEKVPELVSELVQNVRLTYPRTFYVMKKLALQFTSKELKSSKNLVAALSIFLLDIETVRILESISMKCILISHGRSMATSIQEVTNTLCHNFIFEAFDMPIDQSMKEISDKVKQFIQDSGPQQSDAILLFDMGSLSQMYKEIKKYLEHDLLVINNLTTTLALDVAINVSQDKDFKEIANKASKYNDLTHAQYFEGLSQNKNIIVSCMSGVGVSEEIKNIMKKTLLPDKEIITMDYRDLKITLKEYDQEYFKNTYFVITTADIQNSTVVPILNIYDIMEKEGTQELHDLLRMTGEKESSIENLMSGLLQFFTIEGIGNRLQFLNPNIVIKEVQEVISKYEAYYDMDLETKIKLNLYMHVALMIERMLVSSREREKVKSSYSSEKNDQKDEFFSISKNIFHQIEIKYNIIVDDYELSLMYELLKTNF